jgi:hypothetical protein
MPFYIRPVVKYRLKSLKASPGEASKGSQPKRTKALSGEDFKDFWI